MTGTETKLRVHLEDYGNEIYALHRGTADLSDALGYAGRLPSGGPNRWKTTVGDEYRHHPTKAAAKRDLRERAQAVLDSWCIDCPKPAECPDGRCAACSMATVSIEATCADCAAVKSDDPSDILGDDLCGTCRGKADAGAQS